MGWGLVGGSKVTGEGATEADMGTLALSSVSLTELDIPIQKKQIEGQAWV
jgi:hypothetical protein